MTDRFLSSNESASTQSEDWGQVGGLFLAYNLMCHIEEPSPVPASIGPHWLVGDDRVPICRGTEYVPPLMDPDGADTTRDGATEANYVPVTYGNCDDITGPFYHGTKTVFSEGELLGPGHLSNYHEGRVSDHVYFAAMLEPAIWGAELATALAGSSERGHIYLVEPTGPFEDDPNVTNKRFPGNVTQSYRTRQPLRVVEELRTWEGHSPAVVQEMLDGIALRRVQGLDVIED